jgi:uncharacterized protein (DUF1810 family)
MSQHGDFNLQRFVEAQGAGETYDAALRELRSGRKTGHWMWYIFPQLPFGGTVTSLRYSISGREEAAAYLSHPVLGPRLVESAQALLDTNGLTALKILGKTDAMKLRSSATLFAAVAPPGSVFELLLTKFYGGVADELTVQRLK